MAKPTTEITIDNKTHVIDIDAARKLANDLFRFVHSEEKKEQPRRVVRQEPKVLRRTLTSG